MGITATPDFDLWISNAWGVPYEDYSRLPLWSGASNVVVGTNPPYTIQDFLGFYPKWGGTPLSLPCNAAVGSPNLTVLGPISATSLNAGGSGYAANDTGTVNNSIAGAAPATYVVDTVDANGAVLTYHFTFAGTLYPVETAAATTATSGSGSGFKVNITAITSSVGSVSAGNPVAGPGIPDGALALSVSGTTVTLTAAATATATGVTLTDWNAPLIPFVVLLAYIYLATSSLVQARWLAQWTYAVALFVAHFATLYAQTDGNPNSTASQAAAQAMSTGVTVAKSAGDVSISFQPFHALEEWGSWNATSFGQQLSTLAKVIGMGPMLLY
jgi:hypothetical protein